MRGAWGWFGVVAAAWAAGLPACSGDGEPAIESAADASHKDASVDRGEGETEAAVDESNTPDLGTIDVAAACFGPFILEAAAGDPGECVYDLGPIVADAGWKIDPHKLIVFVEESDGGSETLFWVQDDYACGNAGDWYWGNPQATLIELCAATCEHVRKDHGGQIRVEFGCAYDPT